MLDFLPDLACETGLWHRWGTSNLLALVSKKGTRAEFRPWLHSALKQDV